MKNEFVIIDGREIPIEGEANLLAVIRKAGIDLPTFCFHTDLSVYGACRLCIVEIEGRGIQGACSTPPEAGMKVRTNTETIREIRRITIELLLASGDHNCSTCAKSGNCQLQTLARRLGVNEIRFHAPANKQEMDLSSPSLVRDPSKCVLCGNCVRTCEEIQGIGAIDFVGRGSNATVMPAYGKDLANVECVNCGQCAAVCPTGALALRSEVNAVWKDLDNPKKKVVVQIAPAVRVALGEAFGMEPGEVVIGQIVTALRQMGFDKVYDTSFAADLTIFEEATELITRITKGENLPQFTSCCPGWVKFAEQYYPDMLKNLSSCRSPQQMFGSLAKEVLPEQLGVAREDLVVVSVMPCTAKKFEAKRPEFSKNENPDVDHVITTQELARMIEETGLSFKNLRPDSLDMPLGFKTGAGVIFGASGGVMEAALRYAAEKITGTKLEKVDFHAVRGEEGLREANVNVGDTELKLAVVHGLANARILADKIRKGEADYHFIEVMACPGGCINGAGQPAPKRHDCTSCKTARTRGIFDADKMLQLHKSQENPYVVECYEKVLGEPNSHKAHELLHTHYHSRKRIQDEEVSLLVGTNEKKLVVNVCVGTSCYLRGAQDILSSMVRYIEKHELDAQVDVKASFCYEKCDRGPVVTIGETVIEHCTLEKALEVLNSALNHRLTKA